MTTRAANIASLLTRLRNDRDDFVQLRGYIMEAMDAIDHVQGASNQYVTLQRQVRQTREQVDEYNALIDAASLAYETETNQGPLSRVRPPELPESPLPQRSPRRKLRLRGRER